MGEEKGYEKILFDVESEVWRNNYEELKRIIDNIYKIKNE
jgi:hypothetical protein